MPFTSSDLLKTTLGDTLVTNFESAKPGVLAQLITQADSIMTTYSGIQPPDDPAAQAGNEQMLVFAAWIIKYLMCDHLGIKDVEEVNKRRGDYDRALRALTEMRGRPTSPTFERPQAQYVSTPRVGEIL
jgi:hypothetical protein